MDNQKLKIKGQSTENNQSLIKLMRKMSKITNRDNMNLEENKIKEIIRQKNFNKDEATENGYTPLMIAIEIKSEEIALELINSGMSKPSTVSSDENDTALILACSNELQNVASALIQTGESKPETQNKSGNTALIYAAYNKMEKIVSELISTGQSNPGAVNDEGNTALTTACIEMASSIALEIIKSGQSNPGQANEDGDTALIYACGYRMTDVALELIKTGESKPEYQTESRDTALIYATRNNMEEIVSELINTGQSNPGAVDEYGNTALIKACMQKFVNIALDIIKSGQSNPGHVNEDGNTALIYACGNKLTDVALELIKTGESNQRVVGEKGFTALLYACYKKMSEIALELIKTGDSYEEFQEASTGLTALIVSCLNEMPEVALELIKTGGSNPSAETNKGATALMFACLRKQSNIAIELLKTGESNPQAVSTRGETALETATTNNMEEVVKLIKKELYKYAININEDGYNFATMETIKIQDYLKENIGNLCFKIDNHNYFTNKKIIASQLVDAANIKYACVEGGYNKPENEDFRFTNDSNIIYDQQYLSLSAVFGLQIVVNKEEIEKLIENPYSGQLYNVIPTGVKLETIISQAYIDGTYGSSADHCQPGKETNIYKFIPGTGICMGDNSSKEKEQEVKSENQKPYIKIQYKGKILEFKEINDINNITLGQIKQMLLDKLLEENDITSINQNVKFIYKAKFYTADEMKLKEIEVNPSGITLQSMLSPIVGGKKTKTKKIKRRGGRTKTKKMKMRK
jgi:ankyrin repeat protein